MAEFCEHDWEEIWDDGVGQRCCICTRCNEEQVFHYDPDIAKLEKQVDYLNEQLLEACEILQLIAEFADIQARDHEYVTISVKINTLKAARQFMGTRYRDPKDHSDIPL